MKDRIKKVLDDINYWAHERVMGLFVFNFVLMILVLLYNAGYFAPFYAITINLIIFIALVLAVVLLKVGSGVIIIASLLFWALAALFRMAEVGVWAERTAVYTYQSFIVGLLTYVYEYIKYDRKHI